jgi:stage III sporulation protein AE
MPAYLMAAAMGAYQTTAIMYYEGFLVLSYYIQKIMEHILLPAARAYFLISVVGYLGNEDYFSKGREGLKKIILWSSKGMIAVMTGMQMIQGMISPAIDEMKHTVVRKGISSLGSLGNVTQNVTDVILGSGVLLKNGIGAAAAVIIVSICLIPIIEVGTYVIFYQILGILAEPISDKRLLGILEEAGVASGLLVKLLFTVCAIFLLTIAIVCVTTGGML